MPIIAQPTLPDIPNRNVCPKTPTDVLFLVPAVPKESLARPMNLPSCVDPTTSAFMPTNALPMPWAFYRAAKPFPLAEPLPIRFKPIRSVPFLARAVRREPSVPLMKVRSDVVFVIIVCVQMNALPIRWDFWPDANLWPKANPSIPLKRHLPTCQHRLPLLPLLPLLTKESLRPAVHQVPEELSPTLWGSPWRLSRLPHSCFKKETVATDQH